MCASPLLRDHEWYIHFDKAIRRSSARIMSTRQWLWIFVLAVIIRRATSDSIIIVENECSRKSREKDYLYICRKCIEIFFFFTIQRATEDCCPARRAWTCMSDASSSAKTSWIAIAPATTRSFSFARVLIIGNFLSPA